MSWNLKNKTAFVTGASSILGQAISIALAKEGVNLILHYNSSDKNMKTLTKKLNDLNCDYKIVKADFTKQNDISNILVDLLKWQSNIDILINNAAIDYKKYIVFMNMSLYDNIFNINLKSPYILCKNIVREMIKKKRNNNKYFIKYYKTSKSI